MKGDFFMVLTIIGLICLAVGFSILLHQKLRGSFSSNAQENKRSYSWLAAIFLVAGLILFLIP